MRVISAGQRPAGEAVVSPDGVLRVPPGTTVVPGKVLVRFRPGVASSARSAAVSRIDASVGIAYSLVPRLELLRLAPGSSVVGAVAALSRDPRVQYAVPDLAVRVAATPGDPLYPNQWAPAAIGAPQAWDRTTGSASIKVAVIDTGVALGHPDLAANLIPGWNFVANTSDPSDDFGHGTHVAGIIGAVGDNGTGVAGINWHVSMMPLKICDAQGQCDLDAEVSALQYAVAHGAKIANASFGGAYGGYQPEEDAIAAAGQAGLLYVAAAGNDGSNNDFTPFYPASYPLDNIISVAATTSSGGLANFSDYGINSVHIGAPGENVLSTMLTSGPLSDPSGYGLLSGTSMAAPEVTGAAALLWSEHPTWTMQQVRMRLLTTSSPLASLSGRVADCGQLDVAAATDPTVPDRAVVCVSLSGTGGGSVSSQPAAIQCGATCVTAVPVGTSLTFTATPSPGSTFTGWAGACSGTGACVVDASGIGAVIATFRTSGSPPGWQQKRLPSPAGRDPLAPNTSPDFTFFNLAVSADGSERAKTIYNPPGHGNISICYYDTSDTGGVFLERHTAAGWVSDGVVTAPNVPGYSGDPAGRWANCSYFGSVTKLSADGTTLLVTQPSAPVYDSDPSGQHIRCAAFIYRRGVGGWALDSVLYPPGVVARGSVTDECGSFGFEGSISADGTRVAISAPGLGGAGQSVFGVDVYVRSSGVWSLEQQITAPAPNADCDAFGALSLSGDGTTMMFGDPDCDDGGIALTGLVFAYQRSGSVWTLAQTIHAPQPQPGTFQEFGTTTALSEDGNTAVVGSDYNPNGDATWIFERGPSGWQMSAVLPHPPADFYFCPSILEDGARILCSGVADDVGFNHGQGAVYIYDRPAGGWASAQPQAAEAFASDGNSGDVLGEVLGAPEDGSFVDAVMSPAGLISGAYPHDRIGYEFTTGQIDQTLTVATAGSGPRAVTSAPTGIACGAVCWHDFAAGTSVTLTPTPPAGAGFVGWSGACTGTGACTVTMSQARSVTANFVLVQKTLNVSRSGTGAGKVTSNPAGISCGSICSHSFNAATKVTLAATAAAGSRFSGWTGACTGTSTCTVTMNQAQSVTATFAMARTLTVLRHAGTGSGTVTSSPAGISCGTTCKSSFNYGTKVTLTATPAAGSHFAGWSGSCTGARTCTVTMTQARSVTATFTLLHETLKVSKSGSGSVSSKPSGISCGSTCKASFNYGTTVTLSATPATGFRFTGWSGACTGTGTCTVTMSQAQSVTATFTLKSKGARPLHRRRNR